MYRPSSYRKRRRLNKGKFFTFLLCVAVFITVVTLAVKGKLPFMPEELAAKNTPSASPSGTTTPAPTPWPTPEPMPEGSSDPEVLDVSWQDPAVFTGAMAFSEAKKTFVKKDDSTLDYWVFQNGNPIDYTAQDSIHFGTPEEYADMKGVTAFRGNNYRDSAAYGTRTVTDKKLEIVWTHDLGAISAENSYWPGTGWTG